jgi:colanic acid/amylovoran biosynthesis protein
MKNKATNIFIAETAPGLNKGELAILGGMLESFKSLGNFKATMLSEFPDIDKSRFEPAIEITDVKKYFLISRITRRHFLVENDKDLLKNLFLKFIDSLPVYFLHLVFLLLYKLFNQKSLKIMKGEIWRNLAEADVIVFGHDGAFGIGGGMGSPILFYPIFISFMAKTLHKPVVFYGGSIVRLNQYPYFLRKLLIGSLDRTEFIALREETSYNTLQKVAFKKTKVILTADPATLQPPVALSRVREIMKIERLEKKSRPLIGLTVTKEMAVKAYPDLKSTDSYDKHVKALAAVTDSLITSLGADVIFLPHCIGFSKQLDDRIISQDIARECKKGENVKVITSEYTAAELKGLIGQCDLFIGERIHSVIGALTMCIPSIVLVPASDPRLGIIKMIGQEKAICPVENVTVDIILKKITDIWSNREKIHAELISQSKNIQSRAMENGKLLKNILDSINKKANTKS